MDQLTDKGIRIDLPFLDLVERKVIGVTDCYVTLFDTYLQYKNIAEYSSSDNDEGISKEYKSNFRWTRPRSSLVDVEMYYQNPEEKWVVSVEFKGVNDNVGWHFTSPKEALKVYNQLSDYLIKRDL